MIRTIFLKVINMSITASVVICAVIFIRWLFRKQPKIYSYILWSMVLFRLLCPVSISLNTSVFNILSPATVNNGQLEYSIPSEGIYPFTEPENSSDEKTNIDVIYNTEEMPIVSADTQIIISESNAPTENLIVHTEKPKTDFLHIASIIWLIGVIYILLNNLISIIDIKDILKNSKYVRRNIYSNEIIPTAFIMGIVNPKIYIPENLTDEQQEYVLMHEEIHLKRKDYLFKLLGFVAVCIHWFNPLVWLSYRLAENDMEMSCDEAVVKDLGVKGKAGYSQTLLSISVPKNNQYAMHLAFGEGETKERIVNVLNFKKPGVKYIVSAAFCIVLCGVLLITNPVSSAYRHIGIKEKDISTAVFVSGEKYLQLPATANGTVTENLKKIKLSAVEDEISDKKGTHFIYLSTNENNYTINFNEDFTQMWVLADNYTDSGKVFAVDKPEIFKGILTDNINANWDKNTHTLSETVFWVRPDIDEVSLIWVATNKYLSIKHKDADYRVKEENIKYCAAGETADFEYHKDLYSDYDYVIKADYYRMTADSSKPRAIIYIKKINDSNYQIIGGYNCNDIPEKPHNTANTQVIEYVKEIPYSEITVKNHTMTLGTSETVTEGKNGLCVEKVKLHYDENHNIIKEELLGTTVLCESRPKEKHNGIVWNGQVITGGTGKLIWPTAAGRVSRGFVSQYPSHNGIDIAAPVGTYIYAADSGVVTKALYTDVGYGIYCIIEHGGYQTVYAQCSELLIEIGQQVQQGQLIGLVGSTGNSTGPHLHFEVKRGDTRYNPYDWF